MNREPQHRTGGSNRLQSTRGSVILASADGGGSVEEDQIGLGALYQTYRQPIFTFISRRGYSVDDAQDLTQDFFLSILEKNLVARANPERGAFRSLLIKTLQNFLFDSHDKRRAKKRGGEYRFVSWEDWLAEAPSPLNPATQAYESCPTEGLFDVHWAEGVVKRALARLREECEARGRERVFDVLSGALSAERSQVHHDVLSAKLSVRPADVKRMVHQLRLRYRELLREEVARTAEKPQDLDGELRYLCAALAAEGI